MLTGGCGGTKKKWSVKDNPDTKIKNKQGFTMFFTGWALKSIWSVGDKPNTKQHKIKN